MFESILFHDRVKKQLESHLRSGHFHQAYLFSGPAHIGKLSLVKAFVSQIKVGKDFQQESFLAKQIEAGEGPGVVALLDRGESLKVEDIRPLRDFVALKTSDGGRPFCIIEHVERMTTSAANAFLKILEEPSVPVIYLMTTRQEKKLLPTILSRVSIFRLTAPPIKIVQNFLEQQTSNEVFVQEMLKLSGGRIGLALSLLKDEALLDRYRKLFDIAMIVFEKDLVDRFQLAEHLTKEEYTPADLLQFLQYLSLKLEREGTARFLLQLKKLQTLHELFQETQVNKRLFLETLFLSIPY